MSDYKAQAMEFLRRATDFNNPETAKFNQQIPADAHYGEAMLEDRPVEPSELQPTDLLDGASLAASGPAIAKAGAKFAAQVPFKARAAKAAFNEAPELAKLYLERFGPDAATLAKDVASTPVSQRAGFAIREFMNSEKASDPVLEKIIQGAAKSRPARGVIVSPDVLDIIEHSRSGYKGIRPTYGVPGEGAALSREAREAGTNVAGRVKTLPPKAQFDPSAALRAPGQSAQVDTTEEFLKKMAGL